MRDYLLFYLGRSLHRLKSCGEARTVFRELLERYPESRWAPLAEVQASSDEDCPPLEERSSPEERVDCEDLSLETERADCWFRARRYREAKEVYRSLVRRSPGTVGLFYLVRLSQAAARSQDFETAIEANERIRLLHPRSEAAREALRKIAFLHQDSGDHAAAIPVLKELLSTARSPGERRLFWERIGWCHFRLEEYERAVEAFEAAAEEGEAPSHLYWKGRGLERLGKGEEAREVFRGLVEIYGGNYYGIRALERLSREGGKCSVLEQWWPSRTRGVHWVRRVEAAGDFLDLHRISELSALGLFQDASLEIRRARAALRIPLPGDPKKLKRRGEEFAFEIRIPREESLDYPLPYAGFLFPEIEPSKIKIDPLFLYAMMRQESRYRESVVSPAGAVGLLQIMPGTGRRLAKEADWDGFQVGWLYDPLTNIELAVRYLQKLSALFDGKWYAMAASYNAGEQVVSQWLKQRPGLPEEEFIEEIPYQETRDYVKRVYANWKAYRYLYRAD